MKILAHILYYIRVRIFQWTWKKFVHINPNVIIREWHADTLLGYIIKLDEFLAFLCENKAETVTYEDLRELDEKWSDIQAVINPTAGLMTTTNKKVLSLKVQLYDRMIVISRELSQLYLALLTRT